MADDRVRVFARKYGPRLLGMARDGFYAALPYASLADLQWLHRETAAELERRERAKMRAAAAGKGR